jgi:hypothetical protein
MHTIVNGRDFEKCPSAQRSERKQVKEIVCTETFVKDLNKVL